MSGARSMTGYGSAQATGSRLAAEVEIRSVNARSLKVAFRTPSFLSAREPELEKIVREHLKRGTITCFVRINLLEAEDVLRVREEVVRGFHAALEPLRRDGLVEGTVTPETVSNLPGAIESGASRPLSKDDWTVLTEAMTGALIALNAMREREATHLVADLLSITAAMRVNVAAIGERVPTVLNDQAVRLKERIDTMIQDQGIELDGATLAREMAIVADRSDIREEMTRMTAHLDEFEKLLGKDGEIGRTLDFLSQEMLREANTMGSKSQDTELARSVISLKTSIDRLKEQVANLE
jgi:uncharacterized protein (TIGR00255 family)